MTPTDPRDLEIFMRLQALERQGDATSIKVDERGAGTERRLDALEATVREHRDECKAEALAQTSALQTAKRELLDAIEAGKINVWKAIGISLPFVGAIALDILTRK